MGTIVRKHGDIIAGHESRYLVCPVNTIGVMGAGLAKEFRDLHPDLYYHYRHACRFKEFTHRTLMCYIPDTADYSVIMAPTKRHWKDPSRLDDVENTVKALAGLCKKNSIKKIDIPALGCGYGGLDLDDDLLPALEESFNNLDAIVYLWTK